MRIIAGELKGREIMLPRGSRIRPATGFVRELVMNLLTPQRLENCVFLDICAGSGLVGFEALSRGAQKVIFVEVNARSAGLLQQNATRFGVRQRTAVITRDARHCFKPVRMALAGGLADAAFLDPPYIPGMAVDLIYRFGAAENVLAPAAAVFVRTPDDLPQDVPGLDFIERRQAGNGALWIYTPSPQPELTVVEAVGSQSGADADG